MRVLAHFPLSCHWLQSPLIWRGGCGRSTTLEPLKYSEVDFRPLYKPRAGISGAVPFLPFYHPWALIGEENEQWLRYKAERSIRPTTLSLLSFFVHPVFISDM